MPIEFFIHMKPIGKARARVTKPGHAYTPKATKEAENLIMVEAMKHAPPCPTNEPVKVSLTFNMPIPKSTPKRQAEDMRGQPHIKKPDIDNMIKLVLDAITRTSRYWVDDSRVAQVEAIKRYVPYNCDVGVRVYTNPINRKVVE